jgi:protocatechuate 3,4-dioxygenase beta subunit
MIDHDDFGGLHRDLFATGARMSRRHWLRLAAGLGLTLGTLPLLGCTEQSKSASAKSAPAQSGPGGAALERTPEETEGPFPGDGSNGPDVLRQSGAVRGDIRSSFAGLEGAADGVPLTLALTIVSAKSGAPLAHHAVYVWHCDRIGRYSLYSPGARDQNFLRGVQPAGGDGTVRFTTIFPGCYAGRWPHVHFEVYPSLAAARDVSNKIATSQIALPKAACDQVYAATDYADSAANFSGMTLADDGVFSDGAALELATVSGALASGLTATLTVAV